MATFERRGAGWRAKVRRRGYPALSATFDTKAEAQRWAAEIEGDMSRARFVDVREAERTTLFEALARYRDEVSVHKKGAAQELVRIKAWMKHPLASRPLTQIRSADLSAVISAATKAGKAQATIRLNLAIISNLYTVAARDWRMEGLTNPCLTLKKPGGSRKRDRRPTSDEFARVLAAAADIHPELPAIIELASLTAMRRSELVSLRRSQIRGRVAYLEDTKNGEPRAVPLSARARELLDGMPTQPDGRVISLATHSVSNYFRRACKAAGVQDLRLHDLRHEATSRLFEKGLSIMEAASVTGHKTLSQLKRYTHLRPEAIADKLDQ